MLNKAKIGDKVYHYQKERFQDLIITKINGKIITCKGKEYTKVPYTTNYEWKDIERDFTDEEIQKARKIRLSSGDPCMFKTQSLEIAKYVRDNYNQKISVAHNGSDYNFIKSIIDYLDYIALDFKGIKKETVERITGIKNPKMQQKEIIELCEKNNVLVDVRTPLFAETDINELKEIGKILEKYPNVFWTLRKYNEVKGCDFEVPTMDFVTNIAIELKKEFPNLKIGTRNYWKGGFEIL